MKASLSLLFVLFFHLAGTAQTPVSFCETRIVREGNKFRVECPPKLIKAEGAQNEAQWGEIFWEFGDGHYSTATEPEYTLSGDRREYQVTAYLLPYYANNLPHEERQAFSGSRGRPSPRTYNRLQGKQLVHLFTNAKHRLVPGHDIRVVTHYYLPDQLPDGVSGYLVFLYNKEKESGLRYAPFYPPKSFSSYYDEDCCLPLSTFLSSNVHPDAKAHIRQLSYQHDLLIVKTPPLRTGARERRFFMTITSQRKLRSFVPKDNKDKSIDVTLKAVWIPEDPAWGFNADFQSHTYNLKLANVHDPNRLKVAPRLAHFKKGEPVRLEYTIDFQNKGARAVQRVDIKIPWPKNLRADSIDIVSWRPRGKTLFCPEDFDPENDLESCLELDTTFREHPDTVVMTLHNIMVHGVKEEGVTRKKYTKGTLVFTVPTNNRRSDRTALQVIIDFEGGEPLKTKRARTRWRERTIGLWGTYGFAPDLVGYETATDASFADQIGAGFYYLSTPPVSGLGWGVTLDYNRFAFEKQQAGDSITIINNFIDTIPGLFYNENLNIDLLDLRIMGTWQAGRFLRFFAGTGLCVSLTGRAEIEGWQLVSEGFSSTMFNAETEAAFGLLRRNVDGFLFNQSLRARTFIGTSSIIGAEIGLLNDFSIGVHYQYRYFPTFYNGNCANLGALGAHFRLKLNTIKPKQKI